MRATADIDLAGGLFSRLRSLHSEVSDTECKNDARRSAIIRQLENLFRSFPPDVAVAGMLSRLSSHFQPDEYSVVTGLLGNFSTENDDLRERVADEDRQVLRGYIKQGIPFVLNQEDYSGEQKGRVSVALGRVGETRGAGRIYFVLFVPTSTVCGGDGPPVTRERGASWLTVR